MVSKRLGEYIEFRKISFYAFENSISASRGSISKAVKEEKNIGSNVLENILNTYPDLNPIWLIKGSGEMIDHQNKRLTKISDFNTIDIIEYVSSNVNTFKMYKSFQLLVKSLHTDEEMLEVKKEIQELKKKLEKLEK